MVDVYFCSGSIAEDAELSYLINREAFFLPSTIGPVFALDLQLASLPADCDLIRNLNCEVLIFNQAFQFESRASSDLAGDGLGLLTQLLDFGNRVLIEVTVFEMELTGKSQAVDVAKLLGWTPRFLILIHP